MYDVTFNGTSAAELGILVEERPAIPCPEERLVKTEIPGRDGYFITREGVYEDIAIPVSFAFRTAPDMWMDRFRTAKKWLHGPGELKFRDDSLFYYRVKYITVKDAERQVRRQGRFEAEFVCDPYSYLEEGKKELPVNGTLFNAYDMCCPVYKITGEGMCTLTVNGNMMKADVGQNLTVDTELMVAYRTDGGLANTSVAGDYGKIRLVPGENTISVTPGFTLAVVPNWRCI